MTLAELVTTAHAMARDKGWHDTPRNIPEMLALIHSEVSEALEAYRESRDDEQLRHVILEGTTTHSIGAKPVGFATELADVLIRVADLCGMLGIDIEAVVRTKLSYNAGRGHRHGGKRA